LAFFQHLMLKFQSDNADKSVLKTPSDRYINGWTKKRNKGKTSLPLHLSETPIREIEDIPTDKSRAMFPTGHQP
jgi:hypothetical protein